MGRSKCLLDEKLGISERFRVELKVFEIEASEKYPDGIKARFVLIDVIQKKPILLIDNHAPYGFHLHSDLNVGETTRIKLDEKDYLKVLNEFWRLSMELLKNES